MRAPDQSGRSFFWPGLLFLLPMAVLASAGFVALRQDRALARHEATEKAQSLADQIADVFWTRLFDRAALVESKAHCFRIDDGGKLIYPPPAPLLPIPDRLDQSELSETQRKGWMELTAACVGASDPALRIGAGRQFLALAPPSRFAATAQFQLAQDLLKAGQHQEAAEQFESVARAFPGTLTESGLPLDHLAGLKALETAATAARTSRERPIPQAATLGTFCSNLVYRPTFLTPQLLGRARDLQSAFGLTNPNPAEPWLQEWSQHEALRELAQAALTQLASLPPRSTNHMPADVVQAPVPALFWFQTNALNPPARIWPPRTSSAAPHQAQPSNSPAGECREDWLASRLSDPGEGHWIICRGFGPSLLGSPRLAQLKEGLPALPLWLDYSLELAGVTFNCSNHHSHNQRVVSNLGLVAGAVTEPKTTPDSGMPEILASAARFDRGVEYLRVNLHFVNPHLFYAAQQTRTRLFGALIGICSLTAVVGFVATRRAFLRQQQLSDLKSNFVSSVSHELRAPLASMRLLAESLQRGKVTEPARQLEYFRFLVQECRRLSALVENVLNFARIEQGRKQYDLEPADLVGLLRQTVSLMEPAAAERQLTLSLELPEASAAGLSPSPLLDGQAVQQALVNLIDNALKHSAPGQTVTVGFQNSAPGPSGKVSLWVQDHGPGIPAEDHERIFERFYRRGSELRRETQGIGIGLSIVKHVAEAHSGRVRVESQPGQGSRFILELPLPTPDQPAPS